MNVTSVHCLCPYHPKIYIDGKFESNGTYTGLFSNDFDLSIEVHQFYLDTTNFSNGEHKITILDKHQEGAFEFTLVFEN